MALAYVDYSAQEIGIAAALSREPAMRDDYAAGDFYLSFGKRSGQLPADATKASQGTKRDLLKTVCLGVNYGMGAASLAMRLNITEAEARRLIELHRRCYPTFWRWSDAVVDYAYLHGAIHAAFGWRMAITAGTKPTALRNWPMQANGAEMLRLACCLATERGIRVCAPVHDALLVEGTVAAIDAVVVATQTAMQEASRWVLDGFELRTDAKIVRWPDRYMDPRGERMWSTVWQLVEEDRCLR
jgi:DNA polymerase I-like protein with 3'-5' exonuclease and polymerase domains